MAAEEAQNEETCSSSASESVSFFEKRLPILVIAFYILGDTSFSSIRSTPNASLL